MLTHCAPSFVCTTGLANGDWFTTRVSAVGMFACVYPLVSGDAALQAELRSLFTNLCNDDTPMVRKAAYMHLAPLVCVMSRAHVRTEMIPLVRAVCQDDMDGMRMYAIDGCAGLMRAFTQSNVGGVPVTAAEQQQAANDVRDTVLPLVEALVDDQSWRVRQAVALTFTELLLLGNGTTTAETVKRLLPLYARLLKDKQAEVRQVSCSRLDALAARLLALQTQSASAGVAPAQLQQQTATLLGEHILPLLDGLAVDPIQNVRVSLSATVIALSTVIGKDASVKSLLPLIAVLTKDEYYEVRNHILTRLDLLSAAIGVPGVTMYILPVLIDMSKDAKWRVRHGIISQCGLLAQLLGKVTWQAKMQPLLIASLSDHVYAIREQACLQVGRVVAEFGAKWVVDSKFLTQAFVIYDATTNYLHRMTCLQCCSEICKAQPAPANTNPASPAAIVSPTAVTPQSVLGPQQPPPANLNQLPPLDADLIDKTLLPLLIQACTDDVANVKIAAAKNAALLLQRCSPQSRAPVASKLQPLLSKMTTDTDPDVSHFAKQAIRKL